MTPVQIAALRTITACRYATHPAIIESMADLSKAVADENTPQIITDPAKLLLVDTATELGSQLRQLKAAAENLLWLHSESVFIHGDDDGNRVESALKGLRRAIDGKCVHPPYAEAPIPVCRQCGQQFDGKTLVCDECAENNA